MYAKQMNEVEQKLSKTFDAYTDELISKAMYVEKAKRLEGQIQELKELMEPLRKQLQGNTVKVVSYEMIKEVLLNFSKAFQNALTRNNEKGCYIYSFIKSQSMKIEKLKVSN